MAEMIIDIYQNLRRKNPIACGEWLLTLLKEQGLSQSEMAKQLGTNRQILGRYLRMAQWNTDLKEVISRYREREKVSNTDLLKAASSPKNERVLRETIEREENKKKKRTPAAQETIPEPETKQESEPDTKPEPQPNTVEVVGSPKQELSWLILLRYAFKPSTVFLALSIGMLSAYLIHQGIIFFSGVDKDATSALTSSVVSELVPLLSAACFALSVSKLRQFFSLLLLAGSIFGLAFFMHASLAQRHVDSSKQISALEKERASILLQVDTLAQSAASLPSNYISRKRDIIEEAEQKRGLLAGINASIVDISAELSGSKNISLIYGVWLRIAAMILNAILAHALFAGLRRETI